MEEAVFDMVKVLGKYAGGVKTRWVALCSLGAALAALMVMPVLALATETETETKVKEVATNVGTEGVSIVLAILAALVALIVAIIIIPKAVGLIRRFI